MLNPSEMNREASIAILCPEAIIPPNSPIMEKVKSMCPDLTFLAITYDYQARLLALEYGIDHYIKPDETELSIYYAIERAKLVGWQ